MKSNKVILSPKDKDIEILENLKKIKNYDLELQPKTYKDIIVNKPWGYEFLVSEYKNISVWILYMKNGGTTSLHCHETKDTPLILLQGSIKIKTLNDIISINRGDIILINKKTFHSILSYDDNTIVMELEIKPNKCDLFRYKDNYNRENKGYEGITKIGKSDKYFDFYKKSKKLIKKFLNLKVIFNNNYIEEINKSSIYIILDGSIKLDTLYISEGSILCGSDIIDKKITYVTNYFSYIQII